MFEWNTLREYSWYYVDSDLPQTGLSKYQDSIALPVFANTSHEADLVDGKRTEYQFNFLAMISIRRIIDRINEYLYEGEFPHGP